ncbi:BlaI/MecI/CopY family transcriptional regulator [Saccharopolyspora sp. WRP15-2]|uniref:BlaI/MecI/CopY family transcriptional regulator n=1 Tax=Saccharopolyspora oryzae TaxID=2997343 RepID=A0ABT4UQP6_9PSEU|nr:BlaI/MecI/CopY family transcriptional regulator [Saccharopolyspora oryzae]MDA3624044.1 BlaI/MecI/CopY family transcriptional regulator [Saccharopolyspora oryzae]
MGRDDAAGADGEPQGAQRRRSGELSALVLDVLRQAEAALPPGEVRDRLNSAGAGELAYTTVVTILSRLHAQGLVERYRTGRAYAYVAVTDTAKLAARKMRKVLDSETDRDAVLTRFVGDLSPDDERVLRELLAGDAGSVDDR